MVKEGADELQKAMKVAYPYELKEAREAMALAMAYDTLGNKDDLKAILPLLPKLPRGDLAIYLQIARVMEHQGLLTERDVIVGALTRLDQTMATRLAPLATKQVKTIEESFNQTQNIPTAVATTTSKTTTGSGAGPRR